MHEKQPFMVVVTDPTKEEVQALYAQGYKQEKDLHINNKSGIRRVGNRPRKPVGHRNN